MKKLTSLVALVLVALFAFSAVAMAEPVIGQALYAAHGTKCFTVATVIVDGDVIVDAYIDEFQFSSAETFTGVPNSDGDFGENFPEGYVLVSKRENNDAYSANMAERGGATQPLVTSWEAVEAFVSGKTIAEVEEAIAGKTAEEMIDAVSGSTLTDSLGYIEALLAAAKNAQ